MSAGHHAQEDEGQDEATQHGADDAGIPRRDAPGTPSAAAVGPAARLANQPQQHHLLTRPDELSLDRVPISVVCLLFVHARGGRSKHYLLIVHCNEWLRSSMVFYQYELSLYYYTFQVFVEILSIMEKCFSLLGVIY